MTAPQTLFEKIWNDHVVGQSADGVALLYVDRHFVHEISTPQAFEGLRLAGRGVRAPHHTFGVVDHVTPTHAKGVPAEDAQAQLVLDTFVDNCNEYEIAFFDALDARQGIVHIIGPEQGLTLPGMTIVCGDSHTSTHGALGAVALGIGTSEVEHVLATQCLPQRPLKTMQIKIDGALPSGVTSKDLILAIIGKIGIAAGTGHAIEFAGSTIEAMSIEARMTVCNMAIEAGARIGIIAPDDKTLAYIEGRPFAPTGDAWEQARAHWSRLYSDEEAVFDKGVDIDASAIIPTVTWGTNPEMALPVTGRIPDPAAEKDPVRRAALERAIAYMGLTPNMPITEIVIDRAFIGSCTNSRIEDLRAAAKIAEGHKVADHVSAMVVPGSGLIKAQAEAEGLDRIFLAAGFEWREPGCSMCVAMNGDKLAPGERCASTSNRNFEGRQGRDGRTHLTSPAMAVAAAIAEHLTDVRDFS